MPQSEELHQTHTDAMRDVRPEVYLFSRDNSCERLSDLCRELPSAGVLAYVSEGQ